MQKAKLTSTALWGTRSRKAALKTHEARDFGFGMRVAATNAAGPSVARAALGAVGAARPRKMPIVSPC